MDTGEILGVHHIKIPVTDLVRSRAWYERVFDLEPRMEFATITMVLCAACPTGPRETFALALRENPEAARGMAGYDPFAIMLRGRADVDHWVNRLDDLGVAHAPVTEATIGYILAFDDPDGLQLRFYTLDEHGADPEGRAALANFDPCRRSLVRSGPAEILVLGCESVAAEVWVSQRGVGVLGVESADFEEVGVFEPRGERVAGDDPRGYWGFGFGIRLPFASQCISKTVTVKTFRSAESLVVERRDVIYPSPVGG